MGDTEMSVTVNLKPDPATLAALFWAMDSVAQAEFFAALERMAGIQLCFQMAYVVREITARSEAGDRDAQNGFQTMLAHAQAYRESATDIRCSAFRHSLPAGKY